MRLIEANKLKDTECKRCAFCLEDSKGKKDIDGCREMGCGVMDMIDNQPTVEAIPVDRVSEMIAEAVMNNINTAIPVDQVARMMARVTEDFPCGFGFESDSWCKEKQCMSNEIDCWIHAISERWLDE